MDRKLCVIIAVAAGLFPTRESIRINVQMMFELCSLFFLRIQTLLADGGFSQFLSCISLMLAFGW